MCSKSECPAFVSTVQDADCWAYVRYYLFFTLPVSILTLIFYQIADIYFSQKDYAKSVENFGKSLIHDPNRRTLYNRGLAAFYQGWYELAIEDVNRYYEMEPTGLPDEQLTEDMVLFVRASSYLALGEAQLALEDFSKGASIDVDNVSLRWHFRKAACYHKLGKLDECTLEMQKWCEKWTRAETLSIVEGYVLSGEAEAEPIAPAADAEQLEQQAVVL
jgi:tetratricopeptide (TPR) repeat protein